MRIISGGADDYTAAIGGAPSKRLQRRLSERTDRFERTLTSRRKGELERHKGFLDKLLTVDKFKRKARAIRRLTDNLFRSDDIRLLDSIGDFQHAPNKQLRFLMADISVRRRFHQNRCSGWEDRYVDVEPEMVGEHHHDYRILYDGYVRQHEDGTFGARHYPTIFHNSHDELDIEDRMDLILSNDRLRAFMDEESEDPTSRSNSSL